MATNMLSSKKKPGSCEGKPGSRGRDIEATFVRPLLRKAEAKHQPAQSPLCTLRLFLLSLFVRQPIISNRAHISAQGEKTRRVIAV